MHQPLFFLLLLCSLANGSDKLFEQFSLRAEKDLFVGDARYSPANNLRALSNHLQWEIEHDAILHQRGATLADAWVSLESGNDSWPCTEQQPCATIQTAVNRTAEGGTVHIQNSNRPYPCIPATGVRVRYSINIVGEGMVTIDCNKAATAFVMGTKTSVITVRMQNIHINNATNVMVGAILTYGVILELSGCLFTNNVGIRDPKSGLSVGALLVLLPSTLTARITNTSFANNSGEVGGLTIGALNGNTCYLENLSFINNVGTTHGAVYVGYLADNMVDNFLSFKAITFSSNYGSISTSIYVEYFGTEATTNNTITFDRVSCTSTITDSTTMINIVYRSTGTNNFITANRTLVRESTAVAMFSVAYLVSSYHNSLHFNGFELTNCSFTNGLLIAVINQSSENTNKFDNVSIIDNIVTSYGVVPANALITLFIGNSSNNAWTMSNTRMVNNFVSSEGVAPLSSNVFNSVMDTYDFEDIHFSNNSGPFCGGIFLVGAGGTMGSSIKLINITMEHNSAESEGPGAFFFGYPVGSNTTLLFENAFFYNNVAKHGDGGAVSAAFGSDTFTVNCLGAFPKWTYTNTAFILNSTFVNNSAMCSTCSGGALNVLNGLLTVQNSTFSNNSAPLFGGSLYLQSGASLNILDSKIECPIGMQQRGQLIYMAGNGNLISNGTQMSLLAAHSSLGTILEVPKGSEFVLDERTHCHCPPGWGLESSTLLPYETHLFRNSHPFCKVQTTTANYACNPCPTGSYSLQPGMSQGNVSLPFKCYDCPYGADCSAGGSNVLVLANFWGYHQNETMLATSFPFCPIGYCCPNASCNPYNACNGNRQGILCGECKEGYTEVLGSTACRDKHLCNLTWQDIAFWPVVCAIALAFALSLVLPRAFSNPNDANDDNVNALTLQEGKKIAFYFFQVALLVVFGEYQSMQRTLIAVLDLPNFSVGTPEGLCPAGLQSLTVVTKMLVNSMLPFVIMIFIGLLFLLHQLAESIKGGQVGYLDIGCLYSATMLESLLLTYSNFATTTLQLLTCIQIEGEWRLFMAAVIPCWQWWQYILFGFFVIHVLPFPLMLYLLTKSAKKNIWEGSKTVLVGCLLPLPVLIFLLFQLMNCSHKLKMPSRIASASYDSINNETDCFPLNEPEGGSNTPNTLLNDEGEAPSGETRGEMDEEVQHSPATPQTKQNPAKIHTHPDPILAILLGPFTTKTHYWEPVMILRRLLLIMVASFVADPSKRLLLLSLGCAVVLVHHCLVQPYNKPLANLAETGSLTGLLLLSVINVYFATNASAGVQPTGPNQQVATTLLWIQMFILLVIPAVLFGLVAKCIIPKVPGWVTSCISCSRRRLLSCKCACCCKPTAHLQAVEEEWDSDDDYDD